MLFKAPSTERVPTDFRCIVFQMLELACNLVDQMTIGTDAVRVGAVVFGTNANVAIPIGTYVSFFAVCVT